MVEDDYDDTVVPDIEPALKFNVERGLAISPNGHHSDETLLRAERKHREDVQVFMFRKELDEAPGGGSPAA